MTESLAEEIQLMVADGILSAKLSETLQPLEPSLQSEIKTEIQQILSEFISLAQDVIDEAELQRALVLRYIELKARWIMYNTRLQYRLLLTGESDERLVYTASAISLFLEALEGILTQSDVESINQFLVEPVTRFRENPEPLVMPVAIRVKHNKVELSGISVVEFHKK